MENRKWLKRKYPKLYDKLDVFFDDNQLIEFKKGNYKIGITLRALNGTMYQIGTIFYFKRSNPINSFNYPFVYAVFKCEKGYTQSGYHSIDIIESEFKEINT